MHSDNDFRVGCCVSIDIVWPTPDFDVYHESDSNNISYAIIINYLDKNFWLGGDLYCDHELKALAETNITDFFVYKAGHHGSETSTCEDVIRDLTMQYSVISAGRNNSYGHPAASVLDRLNEKAEREVFQTNQSGSIKFSYRENDWQIETSLE